MSDITSNYARNLLKRSKNKTVSSATQVQLIFVDQDFIDFKRAVTNRFESVMLTGRTFKLRYKDGKVMFNPESGHVPCGVFEISKVLLAEEGL